MTIASGRISSLSKQSHIAVGGAVVAAGVAASSGAAQAELIITSIDETAINGSLSFDLNDDGRDDFRVFSKERSEFNPGFADINAIFRFKKPAFVDEKLATLDENQFSSVLIDSSMPASRGAFVARLEEGDSVGADSGIFSKQGRFYQDGEESRVMELVSIALVEEDDQVGPFQEVGDTGYIGLSLQFGIDPFLERELEFELLEEDEVILEPEILTYYGWAEVVRGSLTVVRIGFQSTPFASAPIPHSSTQVSEPATLGLLALGAAGLAGLRRRKKAALAA